MRLSSQSRLPVFYIRSFRLSSVTTRSTAYDTKAYNVIYRSLLAGRALSYTVHLAGGIERTDEEIMTTSLFE